MTSLDELKGHEERTGARRPSGDAYSRNFGGLNWLDQRNKAREYADRDPEVLVVGGGQNGLAVAACLGQLDIDTLVVDKLPRIGDNWRVRYHSLALHNQIQVNHLPYMPFPPTWPKYIPKDMLGDWLEMYAVAMQLNCWSNTEFAGGSYDNAQGRWTAWLKLADGSERVMHPKHIILSNGTNGIAHMPDIPGLKDFEGDMFHSHGFKSGAPWSGKKAFVLGTGNSGHDVAQDLHSHGVDTTIIQRGSTTVVSIEPSAKMNYALYEEGPPLEDCDLIGTATTYPLMIRGYQAGVKRMVEADKAMIEGLKSIGYKWDIGEDETGHQMKYRRRCGGYYLDAGCSQLLIDGEIGLLQFDKIERFVPEGALLKDGSIKHADLLVLATGYHTQQEMVRRLLGDETADRVGQVWGSPGARFDSESYTYGYAFSEELLREWNWSEHFAPQPETQRYLNHVVDRFDLRRDIQCNSRVVTCVFDETARRWDVTLESGEQYCARFLITAVGRLSADTLPRIEGMGRFKGQSFHTYRWPHEEVDFKGKRVAVIGTGATGVQVIQTIAPLVAQLAVFQRTPNWCTPLNNKPISDDEQRAIKANYPAMFELLRQTPGCYIHNADPRGTFQVTAGEREAFWEKLYAEPGFSIWMANFRDMLTDPKANALFSEFVARKIPQRVKDPAVAEKLIPKSHGFGTRRVPQETGYYEAFNLPHVRLVDMRETPIERVTETGIQTSDASYEFDIIIFATGFDAVTGSFDRIEFRGANGQCLTDHWADGPKTFLGLMSAGFPNLLTIVGPHNASTRCNIPRCIEQNVDWISDLMRHALENKIARIEATADAEADWSKHVEELASGMLYTLVDSWMTGINTNVEGRNVRRVLQYQGGAPAYRERCDAIAAEGYSGMVLS